MKGWLDKYQEGGVAKTDATRTSPALNYRSVEDSARIEREKELARRKTSVGPQSKPSVAMKQAAEERYAQQKRNEKYKKAAEYAQVIGGGLEVAAPFTGPLAPIVGGAGTITSAGSSAYLSGRDVADENYGSALMNAGFGGLGIAGYTPAARATNVGGVNVAKAANAADYVSDVASTYNAYDDYGSNYAQRIQNIRQHVTDDELQDIVRPRRSSTSYNNKLRSHPDDGLSEPPQPSYLDWLNAQSDPFDINQLRSDEPSDFMDEMINRAIEKSSNVDYNLGASVMGMPIPNRLAGNTLRDWSNYNELSTTDVSNFLQQWQEQNGSLIKQTLLGKLKDKAGKAINTVDEKLGKLVSPPRSLPEGVTLEKLSDEINKELTKGVGVKKVDFPLRINLAGKGNLDELYANTQIINPATNQLVNAGNITLARQQQPYGSKKFSEVLFPNKKPSTNPGRDTWNNTLGFAKTADFPFTKLSEQDKAILEKQGVSGEFNKAINEVLKRNNLGNILSGGTGHTPKGAERWENLIQKGLAEDLGGRFYKLKKNGGWLDKYEDGGEINYNDASASAGPGFQGDGYSNVGRNYSPAWGGQFQMGGIVPATRSDSINVYNNSKAINDYYKEKGYTKSDNALKMYLDDIKQQEQSIKDINNIKYLSKEYKKKFIEFHKNSINDDKKRIESYSPKNYLSTLEESKEKFISANNSGGVDKEGNALTTKPALEEYYKPVDENTFNQREHSFGFLDLRSPMPLYDKRITPQTLSLYESPDSLISDKLHKQVQEAYEDKNLRAVDRLRKVDKLYTEIEKYPNTDHVQMYEYDPLAVMPWDMVPVAQQEERIRKFGTSGAPANILEQHPEWNTAPVTNNTQPTKQSTPQSTIDFMEGNYAQEPVIETPQASAYGEVVDPRTGYTHMTRQGSPMYPMVGQKVPEMAMGGPVKRFMQPTETFKNYGYNPIEKGMSTEYSTSIGGPGEVYLVPGYRQGKVLQDPEGVFNTYGEHLGGPFKTVKSAEDFGKLRHKYVEQNKDIPAPFKTRDYAMGGSIGGATQGIPGATGFMYSRDSGSNPSEDEGRNKVYKTDASAQNGKEMKFYQEGLDFKPKSISKNGSVIKDDMGQWAHPGEITEIGSNQITMQGVPYPVMGVSDTGDTQMMYPNQEYQYNGNSVTEYPMMQDGGVMDSVINFGKGVSNYFDKLIRTGINKLSELDDSIMVHPSDKAWIPTTPRPKPDVYDNLLDLGYSNPKKRNLEKKLNQDDIYSKDENRIKLGTGRFSGANVSSKLIDDIAAAAKRNNVSVGQLLTLAGRESTFGEDKIQIRKGFTPREYVSGWNIDEKYKPYDPHRFLADKKVPGINVLKDSEGYIYEVADEKAAREYLKKNPQLIEQYKKKLDSTPSLGNRNTFDLSAEFLKEKGIKGYNPGDPNYEKMFNKDYDTLKQDKALMSYLKKKGYKYEQGGQLTKLDQLTNFTNYNTKQPGGWLDKYQ